MSDMYVEQMQVGMMGVFAYIVGDKSSKVAALIDPAADTKGILKRVQEKDLVVKYIINTHGHIDHTGGNADIKKATNALILIHKDDAPALLSTNSLMMKMLGARPSPGADRLLNDGEEITLGEVSLRIIHTPGHSPGSICLYGGGYIFTGDTLFVGAIGRTDLPGGSWSVMSNSLQEKVLSLPDETIVLPGHDYGSTPNSTIGREKHTNPYLR